MDDVIWLALFLVPVLLYVAAAHRARRSERRDQRVLSADVKRVLDSEREKRRVIVDTVLTKVEPSRPLDVRAALRRDRRSRT